MAEKQLVTKAEVQVAIKSSPCWVKGKEIFLITIFSSPKPPKRIEIDEFMSENANLDGTVSYCQKLQTSSESAYSGSKGGRFMSKLVNTLMVIKEVADPFMEFAPESVSIAWFAISSLIQIGSADIQNCEAIAEACNNIAAIVLTCRLYENRYQEASLAPSERRMGNEEVEQKIIGAIPDVIAQILDFSWYVKALLGKNRVIRALKSAFSTTMKDKIEGLNDAYAKLRLIANDAFQERIMDSMESLFKTMQLDQQELRQMLFPALEDIKKRIGDVKGVVELSALRKDFQRARADLRPSNTHLIQFQATFDPVSRYADHICQWLFSDPHYRNWEHLENGDTEDEAEEDEECDEKHKSPNFFFVQARPGFGKSVTLASAIRRVSERTDSVLAYFFFKQGAEDTQTAVRALTSIATQLCDDRFARTEDELVRLMAVLKGLQQSSGEGAGSAHVGQTEASNATIFTPDMLKTTIRSVGTSLKRKVYIVLDGIDECVDHEAEKLVPFLLELAKTGYFKIMLSTRENKELERTLTQAKDDKNPPSRPADTLETAGCTIINRIVFLSITEDRTAEDMKIFLSTSLQRIMAHRIGHQTRETIDADTMNIVKNIQKKAKGMFTYAAIVIASLEQPSRMTLAQKLRNLPKGMDDLYRQRLEGLNMEETRLVVSALKYIVWGFGNVSTIEIAENFKRIYDDSPIEGHIGSPTDGTADEIPLSEPKHHSLGDKYDALQDPEVLETIYHLAKSGRDFFKFANMQTEIDVVHKTVRDWVENEARTISNWQQQAGSHAPKIAISRSGELQLHLPLPPGLVAGGEAGGTTVELQSERDAHLDITINLLTALGNSKFAERYMDGPGPAAVQETAPEPVTDIIESADREELESPRLLTRRVTTSFAVEKKTVFRYEVRSWLRHMRRLQELWPNKEDRQTEKWQTLWQRLKAFIDSPSYELWICQYWQIKHGYTPEYSRSDGMRFPPLCLAVTERLVFMVEYLLEQGNVDINIKDGGGFAPLHVAYDAPEIARLLLKNGATVDLPQGDDPNGLTPLQNFLSQMFMNNFMNFGTAATPPYIDAAIALVEAGADVKKIIQAPMEGANLSVLHVAIACQALPLFEVLMKHPDINIHHRDGDGMTPLSQIHCNVRVQVPPSITVPMCRALLEAGADPNSQDNSSMAALTTAVMMGDKECVELLLEKGADVNDDQSDGITALHLAVGNKRFTNTPESVASIIRLLLMHGADLERQTKKGVNVLHIAVTGGFEKTVRLILNEYEKKYKDDRFYLVEPTKENQTLIHAVTLNYNHGSAIFKLLTSMLTPEQVKEQLHTLNDLKETPLLSAAEDSSVELFQTMLDADPEVDINAKTTDVWGTVLDLAFLKWRRLMSDMDFYTDEQIQRQQEAEKKCLFILERHPELSKQGKNLRWAIAKGSLKLAATLVDSGEDIESVDKYGWTPYDFAFRFQSLDAFTELPQFASWRGPAREPSVTQFPFEWREPHLTGGSMILAEDGVTFETQDEIEIPGSDSQMLFSNQPTPANWSMYYWEITLTESKLRQAEILIGFVNDSCSLTAPPGLYIELNGDSFALQGAGNLLYPKESKSATIKFSTRHYYTRRGRIVYGGGDTIGCGWSLETGTVFFTLNGEYLGPAFEDIRGRWYPAFGTDERCKGKANFGAEPFMYEEMTKFYQQAGLDKIIRERAEKGVVERKEAREKKAAEDAKKKEAEEEEEGEEEEEEEGEDGEGEGEGGKALDGQAEKPETTEQIGPKPYIGPGSDQFVASISPV